LYFSLSQLHKSTRIELTDDITEIPCQCQLLRNQGQQFVAKGSWRAAGATGRPLRREICHTSINAIREKSERIRSGTIRPGEPLTVIRHEQTVFLSTTWYAFPSLPVHQARSRSHPFIFTHSPFPCTLSCLPRLPATFYFVTRQYLYARDVHVCVQESINALYEVDIRAVEGSRREFYNGCRKLVNCFLSMDFLIVLMFKLSLVKVS
jgi:hypothetical protein